MVARRSFLLFGVVRMSLMLQHSDAVAIHRSYFSSSHSRKKPDGGISSLFLASPFGLQVEARMVLCAPQYAVAANLKQVFPPDVRSSTFLQALFGGVATLARWRGHTRISLSVSQALCSSSSTDALSSWFGVFMMQIGTHSTCLPWLL